MDAQEILARTGETMKKWMRVLCVVAVVMLMASVALAADDGRPKGKSISWFGWFVTETE